jgi:hypothetical protein
MLETREEIKNYLDESIRHWRGKRNEFTFISTPPNNFELEMIKHYIDAFQSVRISIFGEELDDG